MERIRKEIPSTGSPSSGHVATYIPQLAKANPNTFGAAICSVNGEFYSCGDDQVPFSVQSCIKPFTYLVACDELSMTTVHQYVSREPSGQAFNAYSLTEDNLPFNPLINAGAITICNLIGQKDRKTSAERFEHLQKTLDGIGTGTSCTLPPTSCVLRLASCVLRPTRATWAMGYVPCAGC